jgi:hypothetical protein
MAEKSGNDGRSDFDWDSFVVDEEFARGGVHEPPARTRDAIARYAHLEKPTLSDAPPRRRSRSRSSRRVWIPVVLVAVVLAVAGTLLWNRKSAESAGGSSGSTATSVTEIHGVSPSDEPGTCYVGTHPDDQDPTTVKTVRCSEPHRMELMGMRKASGNSSTYPDDAYFRTLQTACSEDEPQYTGQPLDALPATVFVSDLIPTPKGWALGDRNVYCVLESTTLSTTSLRKS